MLICHLLKKFSFCFGKVTSKGGKPKACDVLIFAYSWASESCHVLKFNITRFKRTGLKKFKCFWSCSALPNMRLKGKPLKGKS